MKTIFTILALFVSLPAFAFNFPPTTKVEQEDYHCAQQGGGFAIKATDPARVWQVDGFDSPRVEGLELQNVAIQRARCMDCLRFQAELPVMSQVLKYDAALDRDQSGKILLTVKISQEGSSKVETLKMPCVRASR